MFWQYGGTFFCRVASCFSLIWGSLMWVNDLPTLDMYGFPCKGCYLEILIQQRLHLLGYSEYLANSFHADMLETLLGETSCNDITMTVPSTFVRDWCTWIFVVWIWHDMKSSIPIAAGFNHARFVGWNFATFPNPPTEHRSKVRTYRKFAPKVWRSRKHEGKTQHDLNEAFIDVLMAIF